MSIESHRLDQARALLKCLLRSKDLVTHAEARLGEGAVPTLENFSSRDVRTMDRCSSFLEFAIEELNAIRADVDSREAQPELPLGGDPAEKAEALAVRLGGKKRGRTG